MRKVLINSCYGGFSVSEFAQQELKKAGVNVSVYGRDIDSDTSEYAGKYQGLREHPLLIHLFEEHGSEKISGKHSDLYIVEIPDADDLPEYEVIDYDGVEMIIDPKRSWS